VERSLALAAERSLRSLRNARFARCGTLASLAAERFAAMPQTAVFAGRGSARSAGSVSDRFAASNRERFARERFSPYRSTI
jgi:hypothetical protein